MSLSATSRAVALTALSVLLAACSTGGGGRPITVAAESPVRSTPEVAPSAAKPLADAGMQNAAIQDAAPTEAVEAERPALPVVAPPAAPPATGPFDAQRAGLTVTGARGWRTRRRDKALVYEGTLRVPSIALFESTRGTTLEEAVDELEAELGAALGSVRITRQASETTVAGYRAFVAEGTGRAEGFPMRWRATIIDAKRRTVVLGLAPSFFWGGNVGKIKTFERGLQKAVVETASLR